MSKGERDATQVEDALLDPTRKAGSDWFTKLAVVENAKAIRREAQKARKGKPIIISESGRRLRSR